MDNIRVFWGSDHKVGTTMISQSYAELLSAEYKDILLLTFSVNPGDDFYDEEAMSIEEIRRRLSCSLITEENIRDYTYKGKYIHKLNGFSNPRNIYGFTGSMAVELIKIASKAFDFVVIDSGTGLYNPLSVAALTYGRSNYFIFAQQESSVRNWDLLQNHISKIGAVPYNVILNKYYKGDRYTPSYLSQRTGFPQNLFRTIAESEFGIQAEADRKTILFYGDKQYEKDLHNLLKYRN